MQLHRKKSLSTKVETFHQKTFSFFFLREKNKSRKSKQMIILSNGFFFGAVTLGRTTLGIMTLSIMTLSIMTLSVMTLNIMTFSITISKTRHSA